MSMVQRYTESVNFEDSQKHYQAHSSRVVCTTRGVPGRVIRGNQNKEVGAEEQNRTVDTRIFSPLLYLLSYLGAKVILSKPSLVVKPSPRLRPPRQVQQQ
jgi:hypothetical protein